MRILLSCLQSLRQHDLPAYQYWETYFKRGIEEGGDEWLDVPGVDWAEGLTYKERAAAAPWRERTWTRVLDHVHAEHRARPIDLFVSYLYPEMVDTSAIAEIRRLGIPCANFFCDNVRQFRRIPAEYGCFDLCWVPELSATRMYALAGIPFVHAPMPTWVAPEMRRCDHAERYGVSFIGSRDAQREVLLAEALALGTPIEIRGAGWRGPAVRAPVRGPAGPRQHAPAVVRNQWHFVRQHGATAWVRKAAASFRRGVPDEVFAPYVRARPDAAAYVEITQQSRVTLGVTRYPSFHYPFSRPNTYARGRDIEAPMMGACYLTEWTQELEHMYELGPEIETYRTPQEMVEKIHMLESDPGRRRDMRCRAQRRALTEHSVAASIRKVARAVGLVR